MGEHDVSERNVARQPWLAYGRISCVCGWEGDTGPFFTLMEAEDATEAAWSEHCERHG